MPVGAKTSDPGNSAPNYAKPTAAASLRREQSSRNRTARDNHLFPPPPAPPRPTPSQARPKPNLHTKNSYPPNADARQVRLLWAKVMASKRSGAMRPTQASLARAKQPSKMDSGIGSSASLRSPSLGTPSRTGSAPTSLSTKTNEHDFEEMVLNSRGIHIDDSTKSVLAAFHF